jgi:hypothetical protein
MFGDIYNPPTYTVDEQAQSRLASYGSIELSRRGQEISLYLRNEQGVSKLERLVKQAKFNDVLDPKLAFLSDVAVIRSFATE